jgi:hypothetical protein
MPRDLAAAFFGVRLTRLRPPAAFAFAMLSP